MFFSGVNKMSREIRKVPKNWEHPRYNHPSYYPSDRSEAGNRYFPLYDMDYKIEAQKWINNFNLWQKGEHEYQFESKDPPPDYYWDFDGPPPEEISYRSESLGTEFREPAACYQVYETVSEGTPISPKFDSLEELAAWLVGQGYSEKAASEFCKLGYSMSMAIVNGKIYKDIESLAIEK